MTPIQELFSQLKIEHPNLFNIYTTEGKEFINSYIKFIKMEKQEIIDAYEIGFADGFDDGRYNDETKYTGAEQYYNKTFNK